MFTKVIIRHCDYHVFLNGSIDAWHKEWGDTIKWNVRIDLLVASASLWVSISRRGKEKKITDILHSHQSSSESYICKGPKVSYYENASILSSDNYLEQFSFRSYVWSVLYHTLVCTEARQLSVPIVRLNSGLVIPYPSGYHHYLKTGSDRDIFTVTFRHMFTCQYCTCLFINAAKHT